MTSQHPYRLLLALTETPHLTDWIQLASGLLPADGEIHLRGMVTMPEEKSLSEGAVEARRLREVVGSTFAGCGIKRSPAENALVGKFCLSG